jgi:hypothetical protein
VNITRRPEKSIDPSSLGILYLLLVHQSPDFVFRLITALNESQHTFVLHVDLKVSSCQSILPTTLTRPSLISQSVETADIIATRMATMNAPNVFLVPHNLRSAISWGGYSIVNATLASELFLYSFSIS